MLLETSALGHAHEHDVLLLLVDIGWLLVFLVFVVCFYYLG